MKVSMVARVGLLMSPLLFVGLFFAVFWTWIHGDHEFSEPRSLEVARELARHKGERYISHFGRSPADFVFDHLPTPNGERTLIFFFVSRYSAEDCFSVTVDLLSDEVYYDQICKQRKR